MIIINICDAKNRLSKLIEEAAAGNEVIIGRGGKPVARLTRVGATKRALKFGVLKGRLKVSADFDAPLPSAILRQFAGR